MIQFINVPTGKRVRTRHCRGSFSRSIPWVGAKATRSYAGDRVSGGEIRAGTEFFAHEAQYRPLGATQRPRALHSQSFANGVALQVNEGDEDRSDDDGMNPVQVQEQDLSEKCPDVDHK